MPGSYYSDVERTIYLTFVILTEDIAKYDELFQQERKFISFEYWSAHVSQLDYDDLVYVFSMSCCIPVWFIRRVVYLQRFIISALTFRVPPFLNINMCLCLFSYKCEGTATTACRSSSIRTLQRKTG